MLADMWPWPLNRRIDVPFNVRMMHSLQLIEMTECEVKLRSITTLR